MRGHIISYEFSVRKERDKRLIEIENILPMLESAYQISKSPLEFNEIVKFKYEYNCILGCQVNNSLLKLKQKQFELGDKPQKLLAQQLKSS